MYKDTEGKRKRYRSPRVDRRRLRRFLHSIVQIFQEYKGNYEVIESPTR